MLSVFSLLQVTMCESVLKTFISTFFSDITYETLLVGDLFEMKKKMFLFNSMLIYFLLFN